MQKYFFIAVSLVLFGVVSLSACPEASGGVGAWPYAQCGVEQYFLVGPRIGPHLGDRVNGCLSFGPSLAPS